MVRKDFDTFWNCHAVSFFRSENWSIFKVVSTLPPSSGLWNVVTPNRSSLLFVWFNWSFSLYSLHETALSFMKTFEGWILFSEWHITTSSKIITLLLKCHFFLCYLLLLWIFNTFSFNAFKIKLFQMIVTDMFP